MEHIMDYTSIIIRDKFGRRSFSRIISSEGIPNYYESGRKPKILDEMNIDEVYFIPEEMKSFEKRKRGFFYGYKYLFTVGVHNMVKIGLEDLDVDMSHVQLCAEVHRFRYLIKGHNEILIDKVFDSVSPTKILDIHCLTSNVGSYIFGETLQCIDEFNEHYIGKEI